MTKYGYSIQLKPFILFDNNFFDNNFFDNNFFDNNFFICIIYKLFIQNVQKNKKW